MSFDGAETSVAELQRWVEECGYHCAGRSVPGHVCDRMGEHDVLHEGMEPDHAAAARAEHAHGHGPGGHAGMSMEAMERDMCNRFVVALLFTIPIVLWSMVGTELLGTELATPFGIDHDIWQFLLGLPVVLYASRSSGLAESRGPLPLAGLGGAASMAAMGVMFLRHEQHGSGDAPRKSLAAHRRLGMSLLAAGVAKAAEAVRLPGPWRFGWPVRALGVAGQLLAYCEPPGAYESH